MNKQPEALRLAEALEDDMESHDGSSLLARCQGIADDAAAELRRLHDKSVLAEQVIEQRHAMISDLYKLNRQLTDKANREVIRNARLEEANQELLEALRDELEVGFNMAETPTRKRARFLINKYGGVA